MVVRPPRGRKRKEIGGCATLGNVASAVWFSRRVLPSSCSNPEKEKLRHLERGDQYAAEKRDEFAVVEYAAPSRSIPSSARRVSSWRETYERLNNLRAAFPEYIRAADALPDDRKAQLKATQVLLLAGRFEDAKARAAALLAKNPKDVEALLLYANAMASLRDPAGAIAQIEEALKVSPDSSPCVPQPWHRSHAERRCEGGRSGVSQGDRARAVIS